MRIEEPRRKTTTTTTTKKMKQATNFDEICSNSFIGECYSILKPNRPRIPWISITNYLQQENMMGFLIWRFGGREENCQIKFHQY